MFGKETIQVPSRRSILARCNDKFFKLPVQISERDTLKDVIINQQLPHSIELKVKYLPLYYFEYLAIPHNPLSVEEAKKCLGNLVGKLVPAIRDLHLAGWAHQDIRLPNICFGDSFEPIFIDLDRCKLGGKKYSGGGACTTRFTMAFNKIGYNSVCWSPG